jgi:hypothetical protein
MEPVADVERVVRATLAAHPSLFLATCGVSGPWVNGVYFAETGPFTLSVVLERHGRTLAAVRKDPRVAVIVSTGSPMDPFLQAKALAEVIDGRDGEAARAALLAKVPQAAPFLGTPIETVRLTVGQWRVTDIPNGWLPGRPLMAEERLMAEETLEPA